MVRIELTVVATASLAWSIICRSSSSGRKRFFLIRGFALLRLCGERGLPLSPHPYPPCVRFATHGMPSRRAKGSSCRAGGLLRFCQRQNIEADSNPSRNARRCIAKSKILMQNLRLDGFEPSTLSLKVRCSTTELKSRK